LTIIFQSIQRKFTSVSHHPLIGLVYILQYNVFNIIIGGHMKSKDILNKKTQDKVLLIVVLVAILFSIGMFVIGQNI